MADEVMCSIPLMMMMINYALFYAQAEFTLSTLYLVELR